jgi:hypothetical protein
MQFSNYFFLLIFIIIHLNVLVQEQFYLSMMFFGKFCICSWTKRKNGLAKKRACMPPPHTKEECQTGLANLSENTNFIILQLNGKSESNTLTDN